MIRHAQIIENNKLAISLQYFKEKVNDEIDFLCVDKHGSLLKIDTMILIGMVKYSQSFQNASSLCNISKKELEMKLIYCLQINKVSYKMISALCGSKFSTLSLLMIKHSQVLKILSLQYLYNISKKKVRDGVHFLHANKN